MCHRHGHPLYCPEPNSDAEENHRKEGVSIGDVGQLICTGEFDVAFNIHSALNLPPSMRLQRHHLEGRIDIDPGTVFYSTGVLCEYSQGILSRKMSVKTTFMVFDTSHLLIGSKLNVTHLREQFLCYQKEVYSSMLEIKGTTENWLHNKLKAGTNT